MQKLIKGLHKFQSQAFRRRRFFERLADGQSPEALFITCSDSRVNPNLITSTGPGDLFILRNAGNIVPPHGVTVSGEAATIEFAITALDVKDIIICGHTHCGAIKGLLTPGAFDKMPAVERWMRYAESTSRIIEENYSHLENEAKIMAAVEENTLVQIENLKTHPVVASRLAAGKLNLHAWVYTIETGEVFSFIPEEAQFLPLTDAPKPDAPSRGRPITLI